MNQALRLGVAGLGTVGASLLQLTQRHADELALRCGRPVVVTAVTARDRFRDRGVDLSAVAWYDDPISLAQSPDIDVFVELMGGADGSAADSVRAALDAGKHVVTANKALLAKHGTELARRAEQNSVSLNFEAAAAGGIPIIKTLRESLAGNRVGRVYGILNGTCNYILTRMEREGIAFDVCLAEAQRLGYAEADPTFDVDGFDTAHKLALLTAIAFGTEINADAIYVEGIRSISTADIEAADELGYRIKLLGVATRTESGIEQRVHPTMVPKSSPIARVDGVTNAVAVEADFVGRLVLSGPGAGGDATASAVMSDIADLARGDVVGTFGRPAHTLKPYQQAVMRSHAGGYYIRLAVYDRPGAFASIAKRMAENNISLESIVQRRRAPKADAPEHPQPQAPQPVMLITYETTESQVKEALDRITADGHIAEKPQMIRIEQLA
ncbi:MULTISPECIES: homoserine dehydrogenase [Kaistia]|uniref:Homoserine dehydrogenase n=1 Tax=Kaistia nematophila TaxID=2994654 RepID=A0A9X3DYT2_9HYPH|nr:homoserine dehydrogenase [Kaistia nematophila]MBN9024275.1 homoserine dehydrogenase [Hyphomicrobiales bacterium]MCX5568449.1 homoserine dehydrogenase [Kaistia nematophila]